MGGDIVSVQLADPALPIFRLHTSVAELHRVADNLDAFAKQLRTKYAS